MNTDRCVCVCVCVPVCACVCVVCVLCVHVVCAHVCVLSCSVPHHVLYPTDSDGGMSRVTDLCEAGDLAEVWDATEELSDTLLTMLTEAIAALRSSN